jgi:TatD DNase family protein
VTSDLGLPPLVDSHCHLDFDDFGPERDEIVARARRAGLVRMVTICTRVRQFEARILPIAEAYDDVFCTVGTHPHQADEETDVTVDQLVAYASHPKVVGIGECGLDYFYTHGSPEAQAAGFRIHIEAARRLDLPVIIHSRDADEDMAQILEDETERNGSFRAVLHCFSSGRELAMRAIALGHYVSFSGIVTFKKSEDLRQIAAEVPEDRILVETDAPYLAPPPHRGKRNEPSYVVHTHRVVAETKGWDERESAQRTTRNFHRLFSKVPPSAGFDLTDVDRETA